MTGTQRSRPVLGEGEGGKDRDTDALAVLGESEGGSNRDTEVQAVLKEGEEGIKRDTRFRQSLGKVAGIVTGK